MGGRAHLAVVVLAASCSAGRPGEGIDVDRVLEHVATLAVAPRPKDSPASARAADYIAAQLASYGVERMPVGKVDLAGIVVLGQTWRTPGTVESSDDNLLVRLGPPGPALLVMAHYDTVPDSPGAVDNAAAVGVLIELARTLHARPPPQPVLLAFTANEEVGLVGSTALAERRGDEVAFAIALDLIGGDGPLSLNGASALIGEAELAWLADAANRAGVRLAAPLPHRVISRWWPQAERSDHGPFTRKGLRAIHFYNRGQDGEWIDLAYHSSRDVVTRVHRESVDEIGRLLYALAQQPPPAHRGDGFWLPLATNVVVPRWTLVAIEVVLAAIALLAFARRPKTGGKGGGLWVGLACYGAASALAFAVEKWSGGDHPAAWLHAPLRAEIAQVLILVGSVGLATCLVSRWGTWIGRHRYLALAVAMDLAFGLAWLWAGAAELAWVWLMPAALAALGSRNRVFAILGSISLVLPVAVVLAPSQLREAAWNGFLPVGLPLTAWLTVLFAPCVAMAAWWLRGQTLGAMGTLFLSLGSALSVIVGVTLALNTTSRCSSSEFQEFQLACEQVKTWPDPLH